MALAADVVVPGRPRLAPVHGGAVRHDDLGSLRTEIPLPAGRAVIGRDPGADVRFDHESVSPRHALLETHADGTVEVRDLGALNGVRVDGMLVARTRLSDGNRIDLGDVALTFHRDVPDDGGRQGGEHGEQPHQIAQGRD